MMQSFLDTGEQNEYNHQATGMAIISFCLL